MKLLDLAKFRKTAEDKNTATMKHDDGHTMTILIKALPAIHREQLKRIPLHEDKMSTGGKVQHLDSGGQAGDLDIEKVGPGDEDSQLQDQPQAAAADAITQAPQSTPTVDEDPPTLGAMSGGIPSVLNTEQKSIQEQADINADIGRQKAQQEQGYLAENQRIKGLNAAHYQELAGHTKDLQDYYNANPIDENQYVNNMSTGKKMTTGLGLLLGGMAGKGQGNVVMDYLNKQISNNIAAQQQNSANQKTVWGAYKDLYGDSNIATGLAQVSANNALVHQGYLTAANLATPQAQQAANALSALKGKENVQLLGQMAPRLTQIRQQGTQTPTQQVPAANVPPNAQQSPVNQTMGQPGVQTGEPQSQNQPQTAQSDRLLQPGDDQIYAGLKYMPNMTEKQKGDAQEQYNHLQGVDKQLGQIDSLMPQLQSNATLSGYVADMINPNAVGQAIGAVTEGLGAAGAIPTAGASLVGALPGAIATGGAAAGLAGLTKKGLTAFGGTQEEKYKNARESIIGIVGKALSGTNVTPTEIEHIVKQFIPTFFTTGENYQDKLSKLKEKIISLQNTGAWENARKAAGKLP